MSIAKNDEWRWSADTGAEQAAETAWHAAFTRGASDTTCTKEARDAVVTYINRRADNFGRPESTAPPVVVLRGPLDMRGVKAKLRAYEALYGVKAKVAVAGRWVDKGDPVVLAYERPQPAVIKGDTFEVALSSTDTCYVRPETIDGAVFTLTAAPKEKA